MAHSEKNAAPWPSKAWGMKLAQSAAEAGLVVMEAESGAQRPIALSMSPMVVSEVTLQKCLKLSHHLMSAGLKMAYALQNSSPLERIWKALSPLERSLMRPRPMPVLATTRVDCWPSATRLWALELNATIPAMQAYSDIAAAQTIAAHAQRLHLHPDTLAKLQEENGSNARALWEGLLAAYACYRPQQQPQRMGILCRRNDAQLTELLHLQRAFSSFGLETDLLHPEQLEAKEGFWAKGKFYDLVYRHLFVHRLEEKREGHALLQYLLGKANGESPLCSVVLNPPVAPVELKATFALLSESVDNEALALLAQLSPEEREAIALQVPWTRLFDEKTLVEPVQQNPERYVLKKNGSYGGKAVFIGADRFEKDFAERCQQLFGKPLSWEELCQHAFESQEDGGYVVQQAIENSPQMHWLCTPAEVFSCPLYVDFSLYTSVGIQPLPHWGGVCRGSNSRVVNIQGGGGLVPLLREEVAKHLQLEKGACPFEERALPPHGL
ncbi:MAG: hypothetical protein FWG75_02820 [Cystobacterineae bacterium]|nr:hypothetical protein [Cystobacterineae bacterium]